jgi:hypothetical protein
MIGEVEVYVQNYMICPGSLRYARISNVLMRSVLLIVSREDICYVGYSITLEFVYKCFFPVTREKRLSLELCVYYDEIYNPRMIFHKNIY